MTTNPIPTPQTRRYAVLVVPQSTIQCLVTQTLDQHETFVAIRPANLPKTARVLAAFSMVERNAFGFILHDESFEEVPEGIKYPEIQCVVEQVELTPKAAVNQGAEDVCGVCMERAKTWLAIHGGHRVPSVLCARCIQETKAKLV